MSTQPRAHADSIPGGAVSADPAGIQRVTDNVLDRRIRVVLTLFARGTTCSVGELAREVHLSRGQLQRLFKQETGLLLGDYLLERRLRKAVHLLVSSNMSIKEIAFAVGYEHHSSFTRAFENRFALSPKQYRDRSDIAEC